jgi:lauroyl/myristoyl acyltransferase
MRYYGPRWRFLWRKLVRNRHAHVLNSIPDRLSSPCWAKRYRFEGLAKLQTAVSTDRPIILATLHFGIPELLRYFLSHKGIDSSLMVIMPKAKNDFWAPMHYHNYYEKAYQDSFLNSRRSGRPLPPCLGNREMGSIVEYLLESNVLLMAVDGGPKENRVDVSYPGGTISIAPGGIEMARMTNAVIFPCVIVEEAPWKFCVKIGEQIDASDSEAFQDNASIAHKLVTFFWPIVSSHPEQFVLNGFEPWKAISSESKFN